MPKGVDDFEAFGDFFTARLTGRFHHLGPQLYGQLLQVQIPQQQPDRLGSHASLKTAKTELLNQLPIAGLGQDFLLAQRGLARVGHNIRLEIQDAFQIFERHIQQGPNPARQAFEEPDMGDRTGQRDMPHPLPADLGLNDLNAALLTHDPTVAHAFVFAAVTLIVLGRTEYLGAEQAVTLRLERAIIDGLGLLHLPMRPGTDHIRRGQRDPDGIKTNRILGLLKKTKKIFHLSPQVLYSSSSSSTLSAKLCSSRIMTLNDSGRPGSKTFSPFTIAS